MMTQDLKRWFFRVVSHPGVSRLIHATRLPRVGTVRFGDLRRTRPIGSNFGALRGTVIDRYYIHSFLAEHASDIRGRVLEFGSRTYTERYGGAAIERTDVLQVPGYGNSPHATIMASIEVPGALENHRFDCIICTQTLHVIYDFAVAIDNLFASLAPGGVLLATFPGISQIARYDMDRWGDFWRFTSASSMRMFSGPFPADHVEVTRRGNVLTALAFLHGIAAEELDPNELDYVDRDYEVLLTVRARKPMIAGDDTSVGV